MTRYRERHLAGDYIAQLDLNAATVAELRAEAKRLELPTSGSRAQLVERIERNRS